WGRLKAQESAALQSLQRLQSELPSDRQAVRALHARLDMDDKTIEKGLAVRRAELREIEKDLDRLTREREQTQGELGKTDTLLREQDLVQSHARQTVAKALKVL